MRGMLAGTVAAAVLAAVLPAHAAYSYTLDGKHRKSTRYDGALTDATVPTTVRPDAPLTPALEDCTATSCDIRTLRLALPKNTTWGRFRTEVTVEAGLDATLLLIDEKGVVVDSDELVDQEEPGSGAPSGEDGSYILDITHQRLRAGHYTLALVDRAGLGAFTAMVTWIALPPDRKAP